MKQVILFVTGVLLAALWIGTACADNRFVFSDKTVKDKRTGLIWTRDANLGKRDWKGAFELVKELNSKKYAGFKDWRLPSKDEVKSLGDYARGLGYDSSTDTRRPYQLFNQMGFYEVQAGGYWSGTENDNDNAWNVNMNNGNVNNNNKDNDNYVWPVRSGEWAPSPACSFPVMH